MRAEENTDSGRTRTTTLQTSSEQGRGTTPRDAGVRSPKLSLRSFLRVLCCTSVVINNHTYLSSHQGEPGAGRSKQQAEERTITLR